MEDHHGEILSDSFDTFRFPTILFVVETESCVF
jgi:hypothetical protein